MTPSLLMLLPLGIVVAVGFIFVRMATRHIQSFNRTRLKEADDALHPDNDPESPLNSSWVQLPNRWIVVGQVKPAAVRNALKLHGVHWTTLSDGLQLASDNRFFVSLPAREWVFVFGRDIPDSNQDPDQLYHFLAELSRELGTVQYFSTDPVLGHHCWAWMESGQVKRAFAWNGTTIWNQGPMTTAERQLKMECPDYCEQGAEEDRQNNPVRLNAERVAALAARWGVDPGRLIQWLPSGAQGIIGKRRSPRGARP